MTLSLQNEWSCDSLQGRNPKTIKPMTNGMATAIHLASLVSLVEISSNFPLPIIQNDAINKPAVMNMTSVEAILNSLMLKLLMEIKIAGSVLYSLVCCGHINYQFS